MFSEKDFFGNTTWNVHKNREIKRGVMIPSSAVGIIGIVITMKCFFSEDVPHAEHINWNSGNIERCWIGSWKKQFLKKVKVST